MFTLKVENKSGQVLKLTQDESNYQVINIEGLNPPKANINTSPVAMMDGQKFKSARLEIRNIVLTIKVNGNAEENRLHLYEYFATGKLCKIYYKNDSRNVFIEGYCETIECPLFTMNQQMQVSIICPDPYLKSLLAIYSDISKEYAAFEFPFDIEEEGIEFACLDPDRETTVMNGGEIESGLKITLTARSGNVAYPIIYDVDTNEFLKLNAVLQEGDVVIITTNKGNKTIKKISNAVETNIINSLEAGSTWFQLKVGVNRFTYTATYNDNGLKVEFESNLLYEGV